MKTRCCVVGSGLLNTNMALPRGAVRQEMNIIPVSIVEAKNLTLPIMMLMGHGPVVTFVLCSVSSRWRYRRQTQQKHRT
jgi:hypothetical protein